MKIVKMVKINCETGLRLWLECGGLGLGLGCAPPVEINISSIAIISIRLIYFLHIFSYKVKDNIIYRKDSYKSTKKRPKSACRKVLSVQRKGSCRKCFKKKLNIPPA